MSKRAMKKLNSKYKWVIWDWLWTIYTPDENKLYDWVEDFLKENSDKKHILVSWAAKPPERAKLIESFGVSKYFVDIACGTFDKKQVFEQMIEKHGIKIEELLVIGDNIEQEITAARELGADSHHIDEFVSIYITGS